MGGKNQKQPDLQSAYGKIAAYQSDNEEQRKAFLALFEIDKTDRYMPHEGQ